MSCACDYYVFFFGMCFLYFVSHRFGNFVLIPFMFLIKPKMHAIWWEKDLLRWGFFTCPWFNSFNYLWTCLHSVFGYFVFRLFWLLKKKKKNPKTLKIFKKSKIFYFVFCFLFFFFLKDYINYDISLLTQNILDIREKHRKYVLHNWVLKLFLILYEYVLVCTCTHGLIKKLIFLTFVPSIA